MAIDEIDAGEEAELGDDATEGDEGDDDPNATADMSSTRLNCLCIDAIRACAKYTRNDTCPRLEEEGVFACALSKSSSALASVA